MTSAESPSRIIERLGLAPHPEGGWYRETWRDDAGKGLRPRATAIHFLLEREQTSHWHRVKDAAELWLWHAGSPLRLAMAATQAGPITEHVLGSRILIGETPQLVIPAGYWQSARTIANEGPGWTLVSCIVSPGFDFSVFELAPPGWAPGA